MSKGKSLSINEARNLVEAAAGVTIFGQRIKEGSSNKRSSLGRGLWETHFPILWCFCVQDSPNNPCPCTGPIVWIPHNSVVKSEQSKFRSEADETIDQIVVHRNTMIVVEGDSRVSIEHFLQNPRGGGDCGCGKKQYADVQDVLSAGRKALDQLRRVDEILYQRAKQSANQANIDVHRIVTSPWISQGRQIAENALCHLAIEAQSGNVPSVDGMLNNIQRQSEALSRLEDRLLGSQPQTQASDDCASEAGWAGASIAFGIGACAASLGFGCFASAVFAVKALDDATEACQ
ncbi:hypothetical protein [Ruegeria profundi]|uniref:hypothetical protein n=1 Tax=Ruegeria profundi TaxID=1685378 RepID=UPI003C7DB137